MATAPVVRKTSVMASVEIGLISDLKSCHDVCDAASYRIGGRKIRKITSGFSSSEGRPGMNQRLRPTITRSTAFGSLILSAMAWSARRIPKIIRMMARLFMDLKGGSQLIQDPKLIKSQAADAEAPQKKNTEVSKCAEFKITVDSSGLVSVSNELVDF